MKPRLFISRRLGLLIVLALFSLILPTVVASVGPPDGPARPFEPRVVPNGHLLPPGMTPYKLTPNPLVPLMPQRDRTCDGVPIDPILPTSGKLYYAVTDVDIAGLCVEPLRLFRGYSSQDPTGGAFGPGWHSNLDLSLTEFTVDFHPLGLQTRFKFVDYEGSQHIFIPVSGSSTQWRSGSLVLTRSAPGQPVSIKTRNGLTYSFNSGLAFQSFQDEKGAWLAYDRDTNGRLTQLRDMANRKLILTWNSNGRLWKVTDPLNRQWVYAYDSSNQLATVTDPLGRTEQYTYSGIRMTSLKDKGGSWFGYDYDANGRVWRMRNPGNATWKTFALNESLGTTTMTDELGETVTWQYHNGGRLHTTIDPNGGVYHYTWHSATGELTSQTDPNGDTVEYDRDTRGRPLSFTDETGAIITFEYGTTHDEVTKITGPRPGQVVTRTFDAKVNLKTVTDALGKTTQYDYDAQGRLIKVTTPLGHQTLFQYQANTLNVTKVTDATSKWATFTYDAANRLLSSANSAGQTVTYTVDDGDRVTRVTYPDSTYEQTTYNDMDQPLTFRDGMGHVVIFTYDAFHLLQKVKGPLNYEITAVYDAAGRLKSVSDHAGRTVSVEHDAAGQIVSTKNPLNHKTTFGYDPAGRLTSLKDALNRTTTFSYNLTTRKIRETFPGDIAPYEESTLDEAGNLSVFRNRAGDLRSSTYNLNNALTLQNCPTCGASFTYDDKGRLTLVTDANAGQFNFAWDAADRLIQVKQPCPAPGNPSAQRTHGYQYNALGQLSRFTYSDGTYVTYEYDTLGRLDKIRDGAETYDFDYDAAGRRTRLTWPNGWVTNYQYNTAGDITQVQTLTAPTGGSVVNTNAYGYDASGRRNSHTIWNGVNCSGTLTYTLDNAGRLTNMGASGTLPLIPHGFAYDAVGNRTSMPISGGTHVIYGTVNALNQYPSVGGTPLSYDVKGNLAAYGNPSTTGTSNYTYDADNRLKSLSITMGGGASFIYDFQHRIVQRSFASGAPVRYCYDAAWRLTEEVGLLTGAIQYKYIYGPGIDEMLCQKSSSGTVYLLRDALGSTTATFTAAGGVTQRYVYEPFGTFKKLAANGTPTTAALATRSLFTGRLWDDYLNLYDFRHRWYHPALGRFLQPDPIGLNGGINLYTYILNTPLQYVDPFGLFVAESSLTVVTTTGGASGVTVAGAVLLPIAAFVAWTPWGQDLITENIAEPLVAHFMPAASGPPMGPPTRPMAPPGFPGDDCENHHRLPQEFSAWFQASPRNLNVEHFTRKIPMQWHRGQGIGLHSQGYNSAWRSFIRQNPGASRTETLRFLNQLETQLGFAP